MPLVQRAHQRYFSAESIRVISPVQIEARIHLPFGVAVTKSLRIRGFELGSVSDEVYERAKHCLVLLVGSNRLVVWPCTTDPATLYQRSLVTASIYVDKVVHGSPVGHTTNVPVAASSVLEVGPYMNWLRERDFNVKLVYGMWRRRDARREHQSRSSHSGT